MIRVVINGILGRMGMELTRSIMQEEDLFLVGGVDTLETFVNDEIMVTTNPEELMYDIDVVVDFSSGKGTSNIAKVCREFKVPLVTGTTGLTKADQRQVIELSKVAPVVQASNFSIGINLLLDLIQKTASVLKNNFDIEIVELHHRYKKDAPSGTALTLASTLNQILNNSDESCIQFGRKGSKLSRGNEIVIHSLRGGGIIGEHQVHFLCKNEHLIFSHHSLSRKVFVDGAIRAIEWVILQKPGLYTMLDVLKA